MRLPGPDGVRYTPVRTYTVGDHSVRLGRLFLWDCGTRPVVVRRFFVRLSLLSPVLSIGGEFAGARVNRPRPASRSGATGARVSLAGMSDCSYGLGMRLWGRMTWLMWPAMAAQVGSVPSARGSRRVSMEQFDSRPIYWIQDRPCLTKSRSLRDSTRSLNTVMW